jgi:glutathione S-transferase
MTAPVTLLGAPGSPYSRKMRSLLRYRRIPFRWVIRNSRHDPQPSVPVSLIPVLLLPGESGAEPEPMIDSTFQIRRLEELSRERSVVPPDPALAFLDFLLEDYADEWLTKAMFHYRWSFEADVDKASKVLPRWSKTSAPDEKIAPLSKLFRERQVGRRGVVGINETTAPLIEDGYTRLLSALDAHLAQSSFVTGERPGTADFALFGQLSQLVLFEPTSIAVAVEVAPRVVAWCEVVEDLSGIEVGEQDWLDPDAARDTLRGLLGEAGRTYAPFLLGNAAAVAAGAEQMECRIDGQPWVQPPFRYQAKCLAWLREAHAALPDPARGRVDALLHGTGCDTLFA